MSYVDPHRSGTTFGVVDFNDIFAPNTSYDWGTIASDLDTVADTLRDEFDAADGLLRQAMDELRLLIENNAAGIGNNADGITNNTDLIGANTALINTIIDGLLSTNAEIVAIQAEIDAIDVKLDNLDDSLDNTVTIESLNASLAELTASVSTTLALAQTDFDEHFLLLDARLQQALAEILLSLELENDFFDIVIEVVNNTPVAETGTTTATTGTGTGTTGGISIVDAVQVINLHVVGAGLNGTVGVLVNGGVISIRTYEDDGVTIATEQSFDSADYTTQAGFEQAMKDYIDTL